MLKQEGDYKLHHERISKVVESNDDIVQCSSCDGYYRRIYYFAHQKRCKDRQKNSQQEDIITPMPLTVAPCNKSTFLQEVLPRFSSDIIGRECRQNHIIIAIGEHGYSRVYRKDTKEPDVRKSTMNKMRKLAALFIHFQNSVSPTIKEIATIEMMFHRKYFNFLESSIRELSKDCNDNQK